MSSDTRVSQESLRTLHRIHKQLADLRSRLARGPKQVAARQANVQAMESALHDRQEEAKQLRMKTDDKQLQLKTNEDKIEKYRVQLNQAKSNEEYQTLKSQIAAAEMAGGVLEDEILELMEKIDLFLPKVEEASVALQKSKTDCDKVTADIAEREPRLQADIERLTGELAEAEADLPGEFKEAYIRMSKQRGADAMAALEDQSCTGCFTQVPVNVVNQVLLGQLILCKSCGRLLYIAE